MGIVSRGIYIIFLVGMIFIFGCSEIKILKDNGPNELDLTIREASTNLNTNIPSGNKVVVLNIESDSDALSEYIIEELVANAVMDRIFTVVDRKQLNDIREEQHFQISGEVADDQAVKIGHILGAQTIISGQISSLGDGYRFSVRAISVESAQVQGQFNKNIPSSNTISSLMKVPNVYRPPVMSSKSTTNTEPIPSTPTTSTTSHKTTPPPLPPNKHYKIGVIGPAGGRVFYDKGVYTDGWRYLEAAPAIYEFQATWGLNGVFINTNTQVGSGRQNTQNILRALQMVEQNEKAADLCASLEINGYNDWFLPSKDELYMMYKNIRNLDYWHRSNYYWSSSQGNNSYRSWCMRFDSNYFYNNHLTNRATNLVVRAVRAF